MTISTSAAKGRAEMLGRAFVVAGAMLALAGPPAGAFTLEGPPKIAWIYLNAKNDGGWQQAIDEARVKMEKELNTTIPFVESIPDDAAKIKPAAERYIQRGYNIILGSSFGYSDAFKELAEQIRRSPSSTCRARSTAPISGRSTVAAMRVSICAAWSPARCPNPDISAS